MLKHLLSGLVVVGAMGLVGCGPTAEDIVGTWTYDSGSKLTSDCGDAGKTETDLSGGTVAFAVGAEHDLISGSGDCVGAFSFEGGELRSDGYEGTNCEGYGELPEGYTSEGEIYWTYSTEGDVAKLTPTGSVSVTGNDITCTVSYSGSLSM